MKAGLIGTAGLMIVMLFWYGYTYSLTVEAFAIQGYIGALIPTVIGLWLFVAGIAVGWMTRS